MCPANRNSVSHDIPLSQTLMSSVDWRVTDMADSDSDPTKTASQGVFVYGPAGACLANGSVVHLLVRLQIVCASGCCRITRTKRVSRQSRRQVVHLTKSDFSFWFLTLLGKPFFFVSRSAARVMQADFRKKKNLAH